MFTGLIQGMGRILGAENRGKETRLRIQPLFPIPDYAMGESIAVNGACLTVEDFGTDWFAVYASAETMQVTSLGQLRTGSTANLERALALGDRLGGHLVSGHVDCLAEVASVTPAGESKIFRLAFPRSFGPQVVAKGSVALDGISLTVNNCGFDWLEVNIIPATQRETTISGWSPGRKVNMETDVIGKYVQNMLGAWQGAGTGEEVTGSASGGSASGGLTEEFLRKNGF